MWEKCFLTAKVKLGKDEVASNQEFEVEVSDFFTMSQILLLAWLEKYGESIKSRESYHLWDIHFDMDEYPGIPTYVEVESDTADKVKSWVKLLWYKMKDTVIMTESDLREKWGV